METTKDTAKTSFHMTLKWKYDNIYKDTYWWTIINLIICMQIPLVPQHQELVSPKTHTTERASGFVHLLSHSSKLKLSFVF